MSKFIPTGRTSLIKAGDVNLQVQTEYAYRPFPRITSTILNNGKVLHKLEKKLDLPVDSAEEQQRVEEYIKKQHSVILDTIRNQANGEAVAVESEEAVVNAAPLEEEVVSGKNPAMFGSEINVRENILAVPGTKELFHIDIMGNFLEPGYDKKFRDEFPSVFKNVREFLEIFPIGPGGRREKGVYEVERDRLYLISLGDECYFSFVRRSDGETRYERAFKAAIAGPGELIGDI